MTGHRLAEERSLAYHAAIAARLAREPGLLESARARVHAWLQHGPTAPHYAREWAVVLEDTPESIAAFLVDRSERACELRQSTPFAGALSARERWEIWRDVRARHEGRS